MLAKMIQPEGFSVFYSIYFTCVTDPLIPEAMNATPAPIAPKMRTAKREMVFLFTNEY